MPAAPPACSGWRRKGGIRLRPDHKIALSREIGPDVRLPAARQLLQDLVQIAERAEAA
ncbi:MAG: hypothetical protein ACREFS_05510 [Acetobacteraceae bacterium]